VPNHPNYYLGPVLGSMCDSLGVGVHEEDFDFRFSVSPNPFSHGYLKIIYLLPQNKDGLFSLYDVNGRIVYSMLLPPWSSFQWITLPQLSAGMYNAVISSGAKRISSKIALIK